jgi:hypothetical protein
MYTIVEIPSPRISPSRVGVLRFVTYSYRFAEQILNSHLAIRREIEEVIGSIDFVPAPSEAGDRPGAGSKPNVRPQLNKRFEEEFSKRGWESQYRLFDDPGNPMAKIDFMKSRVGVEVAFSHASFVGIDLLKF